MTIKKRRISSSQIFYMATASLLLIFVTQASLVYDYFHTTKTALLRESDAIVQQAFKTELNQRHKIYKHLLRENTPSVIPPPEAGDTLKLDATKLKHKTSNLTEILDLISNTEISREVPLNIRNLDSITGDILRSREINSDYQINIIDLESQKIKLQSKSYASLPLLSIQSKNLQIDFNNQQAIQLTLINPFGLILKRMGFMLFSSLLLSILCLLAFRYLLQVLAKQKQLVAFKNEFLGTIAHELKRPVASLSFNLDCLTMPAFADNRQQHDLLVNNSIQATSELSNTINMIVALAKVEEGLLQLNKQPIDLKLLFDDLKTRFQHSSGKKVEIKTRYELPETTCSGDPLLLTQCFANLIDNAIKYSGSEVLIIINIRRSNSWVVVSITDNGFGIPEEKLPVIFDKYTRVSPAQSKIGGFGIGLNYVKTIVEKHRGEVNVKSQPGQGSEFSVLLPE